MEKVEGLMRNLKLSAAEQKGFRLGGKGGSTGKFAEARALGKVLSENPVYAEGPWKANNDLIVMVDFDPDKGLDDYVFDTIPIWIRVLKLPLGWMNRETGLEIGDTVGEGIDVEVGEDGAAVGGFLRLKARIKITEPLMRGFTVTLGESNKTKWCPFEYEYLPEFCYTCGIIGHDDKSCAIKLGKGEKQ
ncbi:hypothetical protein ACQ4PT_006648 [Festuca glaucescens]